MQVHSPSPATRSSTLARRTARAVLAVTGALALALGPACGDSGPTEPASESAPESAGTATPRESAATPASPAEGALEITRATPLLGPEGSYAEEPQAKELGLTPTGEGILFTLAQRRNRRAVDRHLKGFELIAQSFGSKFRDSRRSVVLRVINGEGWSSPRVHVPEQGTLTFSYTPFLKGMGGYFFGLDWSVSFEVTGAGGRTTRAVLWSESHVLRPPTGGTWRDVELDLAEIAGREGRFVFEAAPSAESPEGIPVDLVAAFANPTITPASDTRPNLLVISIDTLRKDALSPYGADPERTPNLQRLADRGVVFDRYWSTAPWTLPAYASLFTGEYPSTHGAGADRESEAVPGQAQGTLGILSGIPSIVSHIREQGYRTQSFYSNGHLNLSSGIERGFDGYVWYGMTGEKAAEEFHEWTADLGGQPFFAFVQMTDPHWPYVVPRRFARHLDMPDTRGNESLHGQPVELFAGGVPEKDRQDMIELYQHLVEYMDDHVGKILDTLEARGLDENTLVIFHTDHGEELWDHGEWWHGHSHYTELENVALILSWPGHLPMGVRTDGQMRAVDVLPTALDLLGLPPVEHQLAGESFARFVLAGGWEEPPPALQEAELYGPGGDFALTMWPWRLHVQPMDRWVDREAWDADPKALEGTERVMLFNLDEDPKEQHDVAAEYPDRVAGMRQRAETLIAEARERRSGSNDPGEMNVEADADFNLGVLGYADR